MESGFDRSFKRNKKVDVVTYNMDVMMIRLPSRLPATATAINASDP